MASQHPGSRVIICTDGKSNEGVGKVEHLVDTDPNPDEFYESIATEANAKGWVLLTVSEANRCLDYTRWYDFSHWYFGRLNMTVLHKVWFCRVSVFVIIVGFFLGFFSVSISVITAFCSVLQVVLVSVVFCRVSVSVVTLCFVGCLYQ